MKIYVVFQWEEFGESFPVGYFEQEEKAKKYCELQEELDPFYSFYYMEKETMDNDVSLDSTVKPYYQYTIWKEDGIEAAEDVNNDETVNYIYTQDCYVNVTDQLIIGYSINSFEEARRMAFNKFKEMET